MDRYEQQLEELKIEADQAQKKLATVCARISTYAERKYAPDVIERELIGALIRCRAAEAALAKVAACEADLQAGYTREHV